MKKNQIQKDANAEAVYKTATTTTKIELMF